MSSIYNDTLRPFLIFIFKYITITTGIYYYGQDFIDVHEIYQIFIGIKELTVGYMTLFSLFCLVNIFGAMCLMLPYKLTINNNISFTMYLSQPILQIISYVHVIIFLLKNLFIFTILSSHNQVNLCVQILNSFSRIS
jgi:hypothetical protein